MTRSTSARRAVRVEITNGLHLVPCSMIARCVSDYEGTVRIHNGDISADARSILDLVTLRAKFGTDLIVEVEGPDADAMADQVAHLFQTKFETQAG